MITIQEENPPTSLNSSKDTELFQETQERNTLFRSEDSSYRSSEERHQSDDMNFYGPYAHIRKTLDFTYHRNYKDYRQKFQNAIIEDMLHTAKITDKNGDVCTTPTEPWIVFTAGAMGAGKGHTIDQLVLKGRFPLLAFVKVDPDEIRRYLPEFNVYAKKCPEKAGELTRKEAGCVSEILTLAALGAGKNVLVDGSLRDSDWYKEYFAFLRKEYPNLRIAILHVQAPRWAVFQRAEERAKVTGRVIPRATLEKALEQVPKSITILAPLADYFCELNNAPETIDVRILTKGETWDTFRAQWVQTCAWVPGKRVKMKLKSTVKSLSDKLQKLSNSKEENDNNNNNDDDDDIAKASEMAQQQSRRRLIKQRSTRVTRSFSIFETTEKNFRSNDMTFYGPNAHLRKKMDYNYHVNYKKERQWLHDSIIEEIIGTTKIADINGEDCLIPTRPYIVFTAGTKGAGKNHVIRHLDETDRFPLLKFVTVNPDTIRRYLPEFELYVNAFPHMTNDMTRKESGYVAELLTLVALQAGRNVLVDGTLRDSEWYKVYFAFLRKEYPKVRIALLHVCASREAVFRRAAKEAKRTGRELRQDYLETSMKQVPESVTILRPLVDYFCELNNPDGTDIEIMTKGEDWETFRKRWIQTKAWEPGKWKKELEKARKKWGDD